MDLISFLIQPIRFLRFCVSNLDEKIFPPDHSADSFISCVEVLHAGNLLESISGYGLLSAMLTDCQVDASNRCTCLNETKGFSSQYRHIEGTQIAATTGTAWYSTTLLSGVCGSLCRSYIPVNSLEESFTYNVCSSMVSRCMGIYTYC